MDSFLPFREEPLTFPSSEDLQRVARDRDQRVLYPSGLSTSPPSAFEACHPRIAVFLSDLSSTHNGDDDPDPDGTVPHTIQECRGVLSDHDRQVRDRSILLFSFREQR